MSVKLQNPRIDIYAWNVESPFWFPSLVWLLFWAIEILLFTRFMLKLFVPYAAGSLESITYSITDYLLTPFTVIFKTVQTPGPVFELMTLFAALFYWLFFMEILALYKKNTGISRIETARAHSKKKYGH